MRVGAGGRGGGIGERKEVEREEMKGWKEEGEGSGK